MSIIVKDFYAIYKLCLTPAIFENQYLKTLTHSKTINPHPYQILDGFQKELILWIRLICFIYDTKNPALYSTPQSINLDYTHSLSVKKTAQKKTTNYIFLPMHLYTTSSSIFFGLCGDTKYSENVNFIWTAEPSDILRVRTTLESFRRFVFTMV